MPQGQPFTPFQPGMALVNQVLLPQLTQPSASISGIGSPEGVIVGNPGMRYLDINNGNFWMKQSGVSVWGWVQQGTIAQGGVQVIG